MIPESELHPFSGSDSDSNFKSIVFPLNCPPTPAVMYGEYKNKGDFLSDFQKMYKNSVAYNGKNDQVRFLL